MASFQHSAGYLSDRAARRLPRALAGGSAVMRGMAKNREYMWPRAGELRAAYPKILASSTDSILSSFELNSSHTLYDRRVEGSTLRNYWLSSVSRVALGPMKYAIQLEGWGSEIEEFAKNVDGFGGSLQSFIPPILLDQAIDGIHFIMIELPDLSDENGNPIQRTKAQDRELGIQPYWVHINADDFDPLSVVKVGKTSTLDNCAIFVCNQEREFNESSPHESKETTNCSWREYKVFDDGVKYWDHVLKGPERDSEIDVEASGPWVGVYGENGPLRRIPIVPFYGNFGYHYRAKPPYLEPAEEQAQYWRCYSHKTFMAERLARIVTFQSGVDIEDGNPKHMLENDYLFNSEAHGDAKILETSGNALKSIRDDLDDSRDFIREACRDIVGSSVAKGTVTATEIGITRLESSSFGEAVVECDIASLTTLLQFTEEILGESPSNGSVNWRHDAFSPIASDTLDRLAKLAEKSNPRLLDLYLRLEQRNGGIPEDVDIEDEISKLLDFQRVDPEIDTEPD